MNIFINECCELILGETSSIKFSKYGNYGTDKIDLKKFKNSLDKIIRCHEQNIVLVRSIDEFFNVLNAFFGLKKKTFYYDDGDFIFRIYSKGSNKEILINNVVRDKSFCGYLDLDNIRSVSKKIENWMKND